MTGFCYDVVERGFRRPLCPPVAFRVLSPPHSRRVQGSANDGRLSTSLGSSNLDKARPLMPEMRVVVVVEAFLFLTPLPPLRSSSRFTSSFALRFALATLDSLSLFSVVHARQPANPPTHDQTTHSAQSSPGQDRSDNRRQHCTLRSVLAGRSTPSTIPWRMVRWPESRDDSLANSH